MGGSAVVRPASRGRHRIEVRGVVQGVGFRPFVYALARELGLAGLVANTGDGVVVEVEGNAPALAEFGRRLVSGAPPLAHVTDVRTESVALQGGADFVIESSRAAAGRTLVSPDIATCSSCLEELADPGDRRHRHAFISCTHCGPRFTIIKGLPYDRPATTMAPLPLCAQCRAEYVDPTNRRFHAQTVACPACGPTLTLRRPGAADVVADEALAEARALLAGGAIVAIKGIGGYHLACDACDESAVSTLRKRKDRGDKPFAVMVSDLATAALIAEVSTAEAALLEDARRPVVLLRKRQLPGLQLAESVAPEHPDLGVLLAYTPLHQLLFGLPGDPPGPRVLVMTSGNLSGEPIVTDDEDALARLGSLADAWLTHDRAIEVPCDDSVVRIAAGAELPVRRSRGYAPLPVALPFDVRPALAVGGDLKNTFCVGEGRWAWLSAHVGDMADLATLRAFEHATGQLEAITGVEPSVVVADRHPAYRSSAWARHQPGEVRTVQHHHAHVASTMTENGHDGSERVIGFAFDGTGFGDDGAVWGGEALLADYDGFERAAHLRYVWLPGGDAGVRNPYRMALSHLAAAGLAWDPRLPSVATCPPAERSVVARQLDTGLHSSPTSSMGRLFDAVASVAGVCHRVPYEAEAAMRFEELAHDAIDGCDDAYAFAVSAENGVLVADPAPMLAAVVDDVLAGAPAALVAARFHLAVVALVGELAERLRAATGLNTVALSGGVFLNALLTTRCVDLLSANGFRVLRHRLVPPSDAGLALGQLAIAARVPSGRRPRSTTDRRRTSCA